MTPNKGEAKMTYKDAYHMKYIECSFCHEIFRNRYRLTDYKAPKGYNYAKCPDHNNIKDKRFKS